MANLKIVVFVAVLVMFARQVASNDLMDFEDSAVPSTDDSTVAKQNKPSSLQNQAENSAIIDNELTLECAKKHIKACEAGNKCRQIICPANSIKEVSRQLNVHSLNNFSTTRKSFAYFSKASSK